MVIPNPFGTYTLPETNIATENQWLEHEVSFYDGLYSGTNDFREGGGHSFLEGSQPGSPMLQHMCLFDKTECMAQLPTFV